MTVLVTGGAGYIGSHMVLALQDQGTPVVVLDNLSTSTEGRVPDGVPLVVGDVGDTDLVADVVRDFGVTAIAHFAASIIVPESVADPVAYYLNNTARTTQLVGAAVKTGVSRFLFSSTAAVYGTPDTDMVDENSPTNPESPYGASKLMSERVLRDVAHAHGLRVGILRYFNVAGADPQGRSGQSNPAATHLIKACLKAALGKRDGVQVFGSDYPTRDGTGVRDYIHVTDLIAAHLLALEHLGQAQAPLLYNCGYGNGFTVKEVIEAVRRVSGVHFKADMAPRRPGDPAIVVASGARLRAELGWTPRHDDLDVIVEHALAWERQLDQ